MKLFSRTILNFLIVGMIPLILISFISIEQQETIIQEYALLDARDVAVSISHSISLTMSENELHNLILHQRELQLFVDDLSEALARDIVVVDVSEIILADTISQNVGLTFIHDNNEEVNHTILDGQTRDFVEYSVDYPQGINQVVVPLYHDEQIQGAVITSYTSQFHDLIWQFDLIIIMIFFSGIVLIIIFGLFVSRSIIKPIFALQKAARGVTTGNMNAVIETKSIDEITDLEKSFNNMVSIIKKSEKEKNEFMSMVTHELKTPLTPISFHCEMLSESGAIGELNSEQLNSVKEIERNFGRLEKLISDLLDAEKLDMNKMIFKVKKFNLAGFLEKIKNDFFAVMREKKIEFVIKNTVIIDLESDEFRLRQVIDNLVKNAIDFTPTENGRIEIGVKREDSKAVFHVRDNGVGISEVEKDMLFKKFYQVDTSITRKHGGTGLGLAISKEIVDQLGGKIWYKSNASGGVTFYFSIPIKQKEIKIRPYHDGRKA